MEVRTDIVFAFQLGHAKGCTIEARVEKHEGNWDGGNAEKEASHGAEGVDHPLIAASVAHLPDEWEVGELGGDWLIHVYYITW